jgi:hypothetical protein
VQKIAMWRTVGAAYAFVFGHPLRLLRVGGMWLAIIALAELWQVLSQQPVWFIAVRIAAWYPSALVPTLLLTAIAGGLFFAVGLISFAVALHRAVLTGEIRSWLAALRFRRYEWRFLGYTLLIGLLTGLPPFVANTLLLPLGLAGLRGTSFGVLFLWWYAIATIELLSVWTYGSRLMLVFPALAIDEAGEVLTRAWDRSRGNWLRVYLGSVICILPFPVCDSLVRLLLGPKVVTWTQYQLTHSISYKLTRGGELHDAIYSVSSLLELCVLIVFYSYCYQQIASAEAGAPSLAQAAPAE